MANPWEMDWSAPAPKSGPVLGPARVRDPYKDRDQVLQENNAGRDEIRTGIAQRGETRDVSKEAFDQARGLRKDFENIPETSKYKTIISTYAGALGAQDTAEGDQLLINSYAQMLNPTSTVMLGEYQATEQNQASIDQLAAKIKRELKIDGAGRLAPESRTRIYKEMQNLAGRTNESYSQRREEFKGLAERYNLAPEAVVGEHAGKPYYDRIDNFWDKNRKGAAKPNIVGGYAEGTDVTFNAQEKVFDRNKHLESIGLDDQKETNIVAFFNKNRGNTGFSAEDINTYYDGIGAPRLEPQDAEMIAQSAREGKAFSGIDTEAAESIYMKSVGLTDDVQAQIRARADTAVLGNTDAIARGVADTGTLGSIDEIAGASDTIFRGGTMDANLARRRFEAQVDEEVNPYARITGQVAGGFALPGAGVSTVRGMAGLGAGYGGAYGFGSGEGTIGDRLISAGKSGVVGGLVGAGVGSLANRLTGRGGPPSGGPNESLLNAAARRDITTLPADSGGVATRMASGMTNRTLGGIPMGNAAESSVLSARNARDVAADSIGQVTDETGAGQAAQRGMRDFLETSKERGGELFERSGIPSDRLANTNASKRTLSEITAGLKSNTKLSAQFDDPKLKNYLEALEGTTDDVSTGILDATGKPITRSVEEGGSISFADLKKFRSRIGEIIEQPQVAGEKTSKSDLRRLYAGISEDLEATAAAQGPEALTAMRRANQYWRGRESRREGIVTDILGKRFDEGARSAFDQINRWAQNKGDFAKVARVMRSMPADEANAVAATIVSKLGNAKSGGQNAAGDVFSPSTFVTGWNNMDDRAKMFLFRDRSHRSALDDIAEVTAGMKRAEQFTNTSKTGVAANGLALGAGAMASLPLAILAGATQYGAGMFLSRNATAVWIGKLAKYEKQQAGKQSASQTAKWVDRHIGQLSNIAARNPSSADIIMELQRTATQAMSASPGRLAAEDNNK